MTHLKRFITLALCCGLSNLTLCQDRSTPEELIAKTIASGMIDGHTDKILSRMGDAAAVALTKVIAGRNVSAPEVENVLTTLHLAFSAPQIIEAQSDREPRTALFVLEYLRRGGDARMIIRIEEERHYLQAQFAKTLKP